MSRKKKKNSKVKKNFHKSVLSDEVIRFLEVRERERYIDATIGGGGHTQRILAAGGKVLGIDWDIDAIGYLTRKFQKEISKKQLILERANFSQIGDIAQKHNFTNCAGIVFDLGVSGHQLETDERGFSFLRRGALDMRMNRDLQITAADLLKALSKKELTRLFREFSVVRAAELASRIVKIRQKSPIESTTQLTDLVKQIVHKTNRINPATKVFLALRAAVNFELENLKQALPAALRVLAEGGKLLVISFHSGEDGIVKDFFANNPNLAVVTAKSVTPTTAEILTNPAARSARLRVAEKI